MQTLTSFVDAISDFIGGAVANLLLTLAVVVFFWAVINFIIKRSQGATDGIKQGREMLGWSIIGLFVMFSIWGIINFIQTSFTIQNSNTINAPSIKANSNASSIRANSNAPTNTGSSGTTNNPTLTGTNGTKTGGMQCTPLSGDDSECRPGLYCNNVTRTCVPLGTDSRTGVGSKRAGQACSGVGECAQGLTCSRNNVCVSVSVGSNSNSNNSGSFNSGAGINSNSSSDLRSGEFCVADIVCASRSCNIPFGSTSGVCR